MTKPRLPAPAAWADVLLLWLCLLVTFHFLPADRSAGWQLLGATAILALVGVSSRHPWRNRAATVLGAALLFHFAWSRAPDVAGLAAWFVLGAAGPALRALGRRCPRIFGGLSVFGAAVAGWLGRLLRAAARHGLEAATRPGARYFRIFLLLLVGTGLMLPYLRHGVVGAGDAVWYARIVADFITQTRHRVFPVWIGQSEYSFLGGTFPLRMAPYLQYLSGLVDLLTGCRLASFTVLNLTLTVSLLAGLLSCYWCVGQVLPGRPWTAAALAFLYVSCPGVIGLAYAEDLYMSFTALPFLPPVFLGIVRSFEADDALSRLLMAGGLAGAWLAHPPIALWGGLVAAATQGFRIYHRGWSRRSRLLDLMAVGVFAALAGYSFVSVLALGPGPTDAWDWHGELAEVRRAFPGNWLPLPRPVRLENLQLGYGLAALLAGIAVALRQTRHRPTAALAGSAAVLLLLVIPVPLLTGLLWRLVPPPILNITKTWPMQRLLIVLALCIVFGLASLLRQGDLPSPLRRWAAILLLGAVGWSGWQVVRFAVFIDPAGQPRALSARMQRPENMRLSQSDTGVAATLPRYLSGGVMDPFLEQHFLDRATRRLQFSGSDAIAPGFGPGPKAGTAPPDLGGLLTGTLDANPGVLDLSPRLQLEPGRHYLLVLQFLPRNYHGTLIVRGDELEREYLLPISGAPWGFGSEPESSHVIPLWTSLDHPESVQLLFVPAGPEGTPLDYTPFARFELRAYAHDRLPIAVESWIPYRARVRTAEPVYLETSRLFVPGYRAEVDGRRVVPEASPDGLVMLPVGAGEHAVVLSYPAPWLVRAAFWAGAACWLAFCAVLSRQWSLRVEAGVSPPR